MSLADVKKHEKTENPEASQPEEAEEEDGEEGDETEDSDGKVVKLHRKVFDPAKMRKDVEDVKVVRGLAREKSGELGAAYKNLEEQVGYNRKAFKLLVQLDDMDVGKRQDFLRTLMQGISALDLNAQPDLFDECLEMMGQGKKQA